MQVVVRSDSEAKGRGQRGVKSGRHAHTDGDALLRGFADDDTIEVGNNKTLLKFHSCFGEDFKWEFPGSVFFVYEKKTNFWRMIPN